MKDTKIKNFLFRVLCGFFLGISVVAPGVSGSVMAVMMGIYRNLIDIISNPFKNFKKNFFYLLPMGLGAVISLLVCIKAFAFLFDNYPIQARILFAGLVAGGLPSMFKEANKGKFRWQYLAGIIGAFALAATVGLLARVNGAVVVESDISLFYLCLCGLIAGASSMVPGMSVSMILMLLGVYDYLLGIASNFTTDIANTSIIVLVVGICFVVGMVLFSKLTKFIFNRYRNFAYFAVFGFMCGTLTAILPNSAPDTLWGWLGCAFTLVAGLFISFLFQFLGKKFNTDKDEAEKSPQTG